MIKKTVLLLILAAIVTGAAFAEDSVWNTSFDFKSGPTPHKGALFVDTSYTLEYLFRSPPGFGVGLGWEGRINDYSTYVINGNIGLYGNSYNNGWYGKHSYNEFEFGIEANYRYYFFKSALDKLFINAGIGYGMKIYSWTYERNSVDNNNRAWSALYFPVYAGYKIIIGPGFVVEVHAGYRVGIGLVEFKDILVTPTWGGAIYGIAIGWAFK